MPPSVWTVPTLPRAYEHLEGNRLCDVCIVGGGIAGLSTAYQLAKEGASVVVLEANKNLCAGETEHTTAHLSCVLDDRFTHLSGVRGEEAVKLMIQSHRYAIDFIDETVRKHGINCVFRRLDGHLFLGAKHDTRVLKDEQA